MKNLYKCKHNWLYINIILFIILIILFVIFIYNMNSAYSKNKLGSLSFHFLRKYYSEEILLTLLPVDKQYTKFKCNKDILFTNYIFQLVINNINKYEDNNLVESNRIYNKNERYIINEKNYANSLVNVEKLLEDVIYIDISGSFTNFTSKQFKNQLKNIAECKQIVLDLRNCADGSILELAKVLDVFYKKGQIMYIEKYAYTSKKYISHDNDILCFDKMIILCNEYTSGVAEVMINSLKSSYYDKVLIMGSKTFGKNYTTSYIELTEGFSMSLVKSIIYNCREETFSDQGINPDVYVDEGKEDIIKSAVEKLSSFKRN